MISLITEMTKMKPNAIIVLENMQFDDQITADHYMVKKDHVMSLHGLTCVFSVVAW